MTPVRIDKGLFHTLSEMAPEELIRWAFEEYAERAGIITSLQDTGCVMIDMMSRVAPGMRVITIDTLRLHPESYELIAEIEARYSLEIERFTPDPERLERMVSQHGEYLFFDSKAKQEHCCTIRKTGPNDRALKTLDVWFTGLRRDQSEFRQGTPIVEAVLRNGRKLIKAAPLADWTQERIDAYIAERQVPKSKLYGMGYASIGCVICSTPARPGEDKRAGRWRWFNYLEDDDKECGIHMGGSGI